MKGKKLAATLLALAMTAGLGVNSLAADDSEGHSIKVTGAVQAATVSVAWPKPTLVINPYGMPYQVDKKSDALYDSVISAPGNLVNKGLTPLGMEVKLKTTKSEKAQNDFELVADEATATASGNKKNSLYAKLNIYTAGKALATAPTTAPEVTTEIAADTAKYFGQALSITSGDAAVATTSAVKVPAAKDKSNLGYVQFWFEGAANDKATNAWTKNDTITTEIVLKLTPEKAPSNLKSGTFTLVAPSTANVEVTTAGTFESIITSSDPEQAVTFDVTNATVEKTSGEEDLNTTGITVALDADRKLKITNQGGTQSAYKFQPEHAYTISGVKATYKSALDGTDVTATLTINITAS